MLNPLGRLEEYIAEKFLDVHYILIHSSSTKSHAYHFFQNFSLSPTHFNPAIFAS